MLMSGRTFLWFDRNSGNPSATRGHSGRSLLLRGMALTFPADKLFWAFGFFWVYLGGNAEMQRIGRFMVLAALCALLTLAAARNRGRALASLGISAMLVGAALNLVTIAIAVSGISIAHFWWALVVLGVGWNFLYTGGTMLLTETYRPEERAKAQGLNDQMIFLMMLVSSFASGLTVTTAGWERVNLLALPAVAIVLAALTWFAVHQRAQRMAAA